MTRLFVFATLCAVLGLLLFLSGMRRLWSRQLVAGSMRSTFGLFFVVTGLLVFGLGMNLIGYQRLVQEQMVAELSFRQVSADTFEVTIVEPESDYVTQPDIATGPAQQTVLVRGQDWQLDARVLKSQAWAQILNLDTLYRLERISGRYRDVGDETRRPRTVYSLSDEPGPDLWSLSEPYSRWLPWFDAYYGSATYLPMADAAHYRVTLSNSGLLARPANEAARRAVSGWD